MPYRRSLAIAIAAYLLGLAISTHGPWEKLSRLLSPPKPFHYQSLKGHSDEAIASFMSGTPTTSSFYPAGAPETHFPENLWETDPKSAALAFADANRAAAHRKLYKLTIDANPTIKAPDAGWMAFDNYQLLTAVHFGTEHPVLFQSSKDTLFHDYNTRPYNNLSSNTLQITLISPDKARFLAHIVFWLEHIQTERLQKGPLEIEISSTGDGSATLDWFVEKKAPRKIRETVWLGDPIAGRWCNDYEPKTCINLTHHLLTQALPKHLDQNWDIKSSHTAISARTRVVDHLKSRENDAARQQLSDVVLSAIDRHFESPWPVPVLISLVECAGDQGLSKTLPTLEKLAAQLPPASADEKELSALNDQLYNDKSLAEPDKSKLWERYFPLSEKLNYDFSTQLRPPLTQSIQQLHALEQPSQLIKMAQGDTDTTFWALQQLEISYPAAYSDALIFRFRMASEKERHQIFQTLAAANPPAARRLRNSLTENEKTDLLFEITHFNITDAPASAQASIPSLLEICENPKHLENSSERGTAIDLLAKIPLDASQQSRFEQILLNELLIALMPNYAITEAANAAVGLPEPDRFWDALFQSASAATESYYFEALLNALAKLALENPEPRLAQLTEFIRLRLTRHQGSIKDLSLAALALDLRPLAPELMRFATTNPQVPDGDFSPNCNGGPEPPCDHRYHAARHVTALWLEPDPDTSARMWTAFLLNSPYEFCKINTISSCLRERYHSAINAASPELRSQLIARTRSNPEILRHLPDWLK